MRSTLFIFLFCSSPLLVFTQTSSHLLQQASQLSADRQYRTSNQILDEYVRKYPNRLYDKSEAFFLKAQNFMNLGRGNAAMDFNEKSRAIREQLGTDDFVQNIALSGEIYLSEGLFEKGMHALFRAEQLPSEDPIFFSSIYRNIAKGFFSVDAYDQAADYFQKAIEVLEVEGSDEPIEAAMNFYYLAKAEYYADHPAFAQIALRNALRISRNQELSIHGHIAHLQAKLSTGEDRIKNFQAADVLYQKFYGPNNTYSAEAILDLINHYITKQEYSKAKLWIPVAKDRLNPAMATDMDEAFTILDYNLMAKCLLIESQINTYLNTTQNVVESLEASLNHLSAAAGFVVMEQWLFPEKTPNRAVFDEGIRVAEQLGMILKDKSFEETAFHFAQMAKTVSLRQSSIPQLIAIWEDQSASSWNVFMNWREAVLSYRAKPGATEDLKKAFVAWSAQVNRVDKIQIEQLIFGESHKKLVDIQATLSPTDQVAVYHTGQNFIYLFSITKNDLELNKIAPIQEITAEKKSRKIFLTPSIKKFKAAIQNNNRSAFEEYGTHLYQQLIAPMANTLEEKTNLLIIADSQISSIPFDALIKPSKKRKRSALKKLDFLIKHYQISHLLSIDQLFFPKPTPNNGNWILSAPNLVDRSLLTDYEYLLDTSYQTAPKWSILGENNGTIPAQTSASTLVETISQLPEVQIINEIEALTKGLEKAAIWQIQSTSLTHPNAPELASIVVTDELEEGWLIFINEFVQKENQLSVIIFNELSAPEEQFLLPLLVFSTNHIISSVKENQFLFLKELHQQIRSTPDINTAIRKSKLQLLTKNKTAHPMKWAGIQLYGK